MTEPSGSHDPAGGTCGLMRVDRAILGIKIAHLAEVTPVASISPLLIEADGLLGALDLRGTMIPLLDPRHLCGLPGVATAPAFAVILRHESRLIAVGIDELVGLAHPEDGDVHTLFRPGARAGRAVAGAFLHDGAVVTVLSVEALFAAEDIPSVPARRLNAADRLAGTASRRPVLTFSAGEACFAIEATEVHGTVPRRTIDRNSLTSGACLGSITHHGRRIPVMDTTQVLGLGRHAQRDAAEVVVLRYPEDRLLGFAVDSIQRMVTIDMGRLTPAPACLGASGDLLSRVFVDQEGTQIFVADPAALHSRTELLEMARLSGNRWNRDDASAPQAPPAEESGGSVVIERIRHLIFAAGRTVACPIVDVVRIVEPPATVVPAPDAAPGIVGFFAIDGQTLPLVRLSEVLGYGPDTGPRRVLIVGSDARRVGFAVSAVEGIETSSWRAGDAAPAPVVQVGSGANRRILPLVNLGALGESLCT